MRWSVHRRGLIGQNGAVPIWKPHSLSTPHADQIDLRIGDRVESSVEIDRPDHIVPAGTQGRVLLANGFNWQRYRVLFDNGAEIGDLDHRHIAPIGRSAKRAARRAKAARR